MKRLLSFRYALQGLSDLFRTQVNARIHALVTLLALALSIWLPLSSTEWAIILFCIFWVLAAETFNTALEYLTDLISPDYHLLAGKAKDAAAGAVLLSAAGAVAVGLCIFGPKLWVVLRNFF